MQIQLSAPLRIIIVMLTLLASMSARAYDFKFDGICYNIVSEKERTVAVTYYSDDYSNGEWYHDDVVIPSRVIYGSKTYVVTHIRAYAFHHCNDLTSVTIPSSVTSIGECAFRWCSGLTEVIVDSANPSYASFEGVLYSKDLTELLTCPVAFKSSDFIIPSTVSSIGLLAFTECINLTSLTIPSSVTSIGEGAFYGCSGLTGVTIPNSVTSMGIHAFEGCIGLTSVTIGDSVTSIGWETFSGCSGLTSVTIGNSVTSIGSSAFSGCSSLMSLTIPDSVTSIGNIAFSGCSGLTSVTIGNSVTSIGGDAFSGCSSLMSLTIPDSVTSIGSNAFYGCSGLASVTVGSSVTSIDAGAFSGCPLATIYCRGEVAPKSYCTFSDSILMGCILYVPKGARESYEKTDPWRNFWNIEEMEFLSLEAVGETEHELKIAVKDGAVNVEGCAENALIEVYSLNGTCVYRGTDTRITGLTPGIYLVRVGNESQKVIIKG